MCHPLLFPDMSWLVYCRYLNQVFLGWVSWFWSKLRSMERGAASTVVPISFPIVIGSMAYTLRHSHVISTKLVHLGRIRIYHIGFDISSWDILVDRFQHPAPHIEYLDINYQLLCYRFLHFSIRHFCRWRTTLETTRYDAVSRWFPRPSSLIFNCTIRRVLKGIKCTDTVGMVRKSQPSPFTYFSSSIKFHVLAGPFHVGGKARLSKLNFRFCLTWI